MKIAYKHLAKHIYPAPSLNDLSDKLFQLGHEHEILDEIFDIEFTPNRGDCLSINGLLRDLNVFYDIKFNNEKFDDQIKSYEIDFVNNAIDDCPRISFLKIEVDGAIKSYEDELNEYFKIFDINKKNFFTDVSNYIAYETGQPTHCYDSKKIKNQLCLDEINTTSNFSTLLDKDIKLVGKNLVFLNDKKVINLAGVVGGESTSCSSETRSVLVECAYFNPEKIIGKCIKYGIQSDAAYKFERGVDPSCQEDVLRRFIYIVQKHANILSLELFSKTYKKYTKKLIPYDLNAINNIIGSDINNNEYKIYLRSLGFTISKNTIEVPSHRSDVTTQNDLAEEVARCIGYNNINIAPLQLKKSKSLKGFERVKEERIKGLLIDNGFNEVINPPFSEISLNNAIKLDNPIDSNKPYFRENLKVSLIENLLFNERRQQDSVKLYEISDIYTQDADGTQVKQRKLGIIASGRMGKNYKNFSKKIDQTYISSILFRYASNLESVEEEIHRNNLNTKAKAKIYFLEINLSEFNEAILEYESESSRLKEFIDYRPISDMPKIYRDLSYSLSNNASMENLNNLITKFENKFLKEVFVFDFYENTNKIKIGYRFIFQSNEKTLTDEDVNQIFKPLIEESLAIDGIEIPGIK